MGLGDFGEQTKLMNSPHETLGSADKIVGCGVRLKLLGKPFSLQFRLGIRPPCDQRRKDLQATFRNQKGELESECSLHQMPTCVGRERFGNNFFEGCKELALTEL